MRVWGVVPVPVHALMYIYGARGCLGCLSLVSRLFVLFVFEMLSLTELRQQDPEICPSLPPQNWGYRSVPPPQDFYESAGDLTSSSHAYAASPLPTEPSS